MPALLLQRCLQHPEREAVARCPECARFFCRECITEHDERVICAGCLARLARGAAERKPRRAGAVLALLRPAAAALAGLLVAWFCFYGLGRGLLALPSEFHADTLWDGLSASPASEEIAAPPPP